MGLITTVVIMNDALNDIADDSDFGKKLAKAVNELTSSRMAGNDVVYVSSGHRSNAAIVVETHHSDHTAVVTVGGGIGIKQTSFYGRNHDMPEGREAVLRAWAKELGFNLSEKEA